jgi:predicted dehydrogenase
MDLNIHSPLPHRKDFRIGILGAGFIVSDCHLVAYRKAGFNPAAIAARTGERAENVARQHAIAKIYETAEQLLADPEIEVLDIAVPPMQQLALIKAACERKTVKGILAQKPLAMNYAEAVEAVRVCDAAGIALAVNQNMRYDQSVRAAKALLENGALGEPVFATIDMRGVPHWMDWHRELGWLTLRIMSIHHLDTFRYWFGNPEGIYCSVRTDPRTKFSHTDGICTYVVEYGDGLRCVGIDDTWTGPAKEGCPADIRIEWRIEGTKGLAIGDIGWCKNPYTTPSTIRYATIGDKDWHRPTWSESWFPDAFIGTMAQLLIALETDQEPAISGRDNLKTMALVEAAYVSAAQSRSIGLDVIERTEGTPVQIPARKPSGFFGRLFSTPSIPPEIPAQVQRHASAEALCNFTPLAQQALALARKEADRFNHNFVGTEHVLLGLIKLGQGVAVNVLQKMGLDLETVRIEVEKQVGTGPDQKMIGNIPYTPRVKKVLALAQKEAKALNHTYVGTEHILLGLLREGDGVAARILKSLKVDIERARQEILKELDPNFGGEESKR